MKWFQGFHSSKVPRLRSEGSNVAVQRATWNSDRTKPVERWNLEQWNTEKVGSFDASQCLVVVICLCSPFLSDATRVVPLSFEQLVNESQSVVYGRVSDVRAQWTADRRFIESVVTIEILRGMKGARASRSRLRCRADRSDDT